jgi:branched-chain amino acid transport system substrate-binding protein
LIGHVAPFSGPDRQIGEHAKQAIELAVATTNKAENGIAGRRLAVLHVDSRSELDTLQPEAVRLITVNGAVALLAGTSSAEVERLGQATQPYAVSLVTPAAVPPNLQADNVFSVNASLSFRAGVLARFTCKELKAERVVILLDSRRTSETALAEAFQISFAKASGRAPEQRVYQNTAELAQAVQGLKEAKPQAVLYAGAVMELAKARQVLREAGLTVPILFGGNEEYLATQEADTRATDGIYLATPYALEGSGHETQDFARKYREQFQADPDISALLAYDGIRVLVQAMRKGKSLRPADVGAGLADFLTDPFDSLSGRILFAKDHSARRPLVIVRLERGKMQALQRFEPGATE